MPAIKKVEKNEIIKAAFEILRQNGIEALNARSLAKKMNCSTKPIYLQFMNMDEIKVELKKLAESAYIDTARKALTENENSYRMHGLAYIRFAKEEKQLFRFLYLNGRNENSQRQIDDATYDDIIKALRKKFSFDEETAKKFHFEMAIFSYGLAVMVNTDYVELTEEEVGNILLDQCLAQYELYKSRGLI